VPAFSSWPHVTNAHRSEVFVGEANDLRTPTHFPGKLETTRNRHLPFVVTIGNNQHQRHFEPLLRPAFPIRRS
jgi:hypothetical protein